MSFAEYMENYFLKNNYSESQRQRVESDPRYKEAFKREDSKAVRLIAVIVIHEKYKYSKQPPRNLWPGIRP
jgi:hypothetical protein